MKLYTAADIRALAKRGESQLDLAPGDRVTAEAEDEAARLAIVLARRPDSPPAGPAQPPRGGRTVKVVRGGQTPLEPFAFDVKRPDMNIRTTDVVAEADGSPMGAGFMSMERGAFPWTLNYDEIDIVLEGELVIKVGETSYEGHAGDVIYIPKGTSIEFCTPTRCRFVYVTFPVNWNAQ